MSDKPPVPVAVSVSWHTLVPIIATALVLVISSSFAALLAYQNARTANRIASSVDNVHVLVNSGMTKALTDLAASQEQVRQLKELVIKLDQRLGGGNVGLVAAPAIEPTPQDVIDAQRATPRHDPPQPDG